MKDRVWQPKRFHKRCRFPSRIWLIDRRKKEYRKIGNVRVGELLIMRAEEPGEVSRRWFLTDNAGIPGVGYSRLDAALDLKRGYPREFRSASEDRRYD